MPFIVRWPGLVAANTVSHALISQIRFDGDVAAVTGYGLPAGQALDSYDMLAVWQKRAASPRRSMVHNTQADSYAVRRDQWVLIAANTGAVTRVPPWFDQENRYPKNDHAGELYDLGKGLAQRNNLSAVHRKKVAELTALLAATRARGEVRLTRSLTQRTPRAQRIE